MTGGFQSNDWPDVALIGGLRRPLTFSHSIKKPLSGGNSGARANNGGAKTGQLVQRSRRQEASVTLPAKGCGPSRCRFLKTFFRLRHSGVVATGDLVPQRDPSNGDQRSPAPCAAGDFLGSLVGFLASRLPRGSRRRKVRGCHARDVPSVCRRSRTRIVTTRPAWDVEGLDIFELDNYTTRSA